MVVADDVLVVDPVLDFAVLLGRTEEQQPLYGPTATYEFLTPVPVQANVALVRRNIAHLVDRTGEIVWVDVDLALESENLGELRKYCEELVRLKI